MLDLKKLENKLDQALANETADSMTQWLLKKRKLSYLTQLNRFTIHLLPRSLMYLLAKRMSTFRRFLTILLIQWLHNEYQRTSSVKILWY